MRQYNIINDGLPEEFYKMLKVDFYDSEEQDDDTFCTVTSLLKPPKLFWLEKRHRSEIKKPASELIWSQFGSSMHHLLELALKNNPRYQLEKRSYKEINIDGEQVKISGKFDIYDKETLYLKDLKTTSVYKIMAVLEGEDTKWEQQLNIYKWLNDDIDINGIAVLYFAKDWNKHKAQYDQNYPQSDVGEIYINLHSDESIEKDIVKMLKDKLKYKDTDDDNIPPCPVLERWQDPASLALYKETGLTKKNTIKKRGRAHKLFYNLEELISYIYRNKITKFGVQYRPTGNPKRCEKYCDVSQYCSYYKNLHNLMFADEKPTIDIVLDYNNTVDVARFTIKEMTSYFQNQLSVISNSDKKSLGV